MHDHNMALRAQRPVARFATRLTMVWMLLAVLAGPALAVDIGIFAQAEPDCTLLRNGENRQCSKGALIADGDVLATSREVSSLRINWVAKNRTRLEPQQPGSYRASLDRPARPWGFLSDAAEIVGFSKLSAQTRHLMATRAGAGHSISPGLRATLLPGRAFTLAWCESAATALVVRTASGEEVFRASIRSEARLRLTPEDMGLKPGQTYVWEAVGGGGGGEFSLLDVEEARSLDAGLKELPGPAEKAHLLHFLSQVYSGRLNLDWLALELLPACGRDCSPQARKQLLELRQALVKSLGECPNPVLLDD